MCTIYLILRLYKQMQDRRTNDNLDNLLNVQSFLDEIFIHLANSPDLKSSYFQNTSC
jgi:hypothetical protein